MMFCPLPLKTIASVESPKYPMKTVQLKRGEGDLSGRDPSKVSRYDPKENPRLQMTKNQQMTLNIICQGCVLFVGSQTLFFEQNFIVELWFTNPAK